MIYFGTYLVDMMFFANPEPGFSIYQALLVWRPMLIGLSLILCAIAAEILARSAQGSTVSFLFRWPRWRLDGE